MPVSQFPALCAYYLSQPQPRQVLPTPPVLPIVYQEALCFLWMETARCGILSPEGL